MMEENYPRHRNSCEYYSKRKKPFVKDRSGQRYASDKEGKDKPGLQYYFPDQHPHTIPVSMYHHTHLALTRLFCEEKSISNPSHSEESMEILKEKPPTLDEKLENE
ncbi:hypothetical protein TNCV_3316561 [Trichonephila clavipes]|nr:hypothetical protein TNCV_3316561 [Trichonephila clavipes]